MSRRSGVAAPASLALVAMLAVLWAAPALAAEAPAPPTVSPAAEPGGIGLRLVDAPVEAREDPRAQVYIVDHLAPGTTIERRIEVSNTTASPADVVLYPGAADITDGSFVGAPAGNQNDLSTWTSVTPEAPQVAAGGTQMATVTIAVPADAAPGEQYGVVWAEVRSAEATGGGVTQVSRVGLRLYVSVGPGNPPAMDFTIDSLTAVRSVDGLPTVLATVHNTGGRALDLNGTLQLLDGPGGLSAGPFPATLGSTLAVGATGPVSIELDDALPAGPWQASITLKSGLVERTAEATITFPDEGAAVPVTTGSDRPAWLYPVVAGAAVLLLVMAALAARHWPRRRVDGSRTLPTSAPVGVRPDGSGPGNRATRHRTMTP